MTDIGKSLWGTLSKLFPESFSDSSTSDLQVSRDELTRDEFMKLFKCGVLPPSEAYYQGFYAAQQGEPRRNCPYVRHDDLWEDWMDGYKDYIKR